MEYAASLAACGEEAEALRHGRKAVHFFRETIVMPRSAKRAERVLHDITQRSLLKVIA
jgi:hypothetical protein